METDLRFDGGTIFVHFSGRVKNLCMKNTPILGGHNPKYQLCVCSAAAGPQSKKHLSVSINRFCDNQDKREEEVKKERSRETM